MDPVGVGATSWFKLAALSEWMWVLPRQKQFYAASRAGHPEITSSIIGCHKKAWDSMGYSFLFLQVIGPTVELGRKVLGFGKRVGE